ncbi:MAG: WYL domain-containing protein [Chitinophagaceae bacterium]|nr:MAG: WYL domain-containing protein [Chitinophagaceae bacterium]
MPVNRNALIRYRTLDKCLGNKYRKWTLEDLIDACSDALYEYEGIDKGVSRRTVQGDLEMMRSSKLGYNAPIIVTDKKYYSYADSKYSITNIPLSTRDMQVLSEVADLLKQFKGFNHFSDVTEMVSKLENKVYVQKTASASAIEFEKNDNLKGLEHIEMIRKAIIARNVLCVTYQSFKARHASTFCISPYLLKEYRNRWFVLCESHQKNRPLLTLALDRIEAIGQSGEVYRENKTLDLNTYYSDLIGVTKTPGQRDCEVIFQIDHANAPYILTKPLHHTQKLLDKNAEGKIFSIRVILNYELERELLGFGCRIKVLSPRILVRNIRQQLSKALECYEEVDDGAPSQPISI